MSGRHPLRGSRKGGPAINLFPCFEEALRTVHRDSYVEVKGAYYEVPDQFIGKQVWTRLDSKMIPDPVCGLVHFESQQ